jgi:hypothetical protein
MNSVVLLLLMILVLLPFSNSHKGTMIQYVDILKEILKLEYGPISSPIVLFPYK